MINFFKKRIIGYNMIKYITWVFQGSLQLSYDGYHCGCCGSWTDEKFTVPKYKSAGRWWDTWGLCKVCIDE